MDHQSRGPADLQSVEKGPNVYLNPGLATVSTQCSPFSFLEACGGLNRHSQIVAGRTDSTPGSTGAESLGDRAKSRYSGDHRDGVFGRASSSFATGLRTSGRPLPNSFDTSDELIVAKTERAEAYSVRANRSLKGIRTLSTLMKAWQAFRPCWVAPAAVVSAVSAAGCSGRDP
jgi:hypothetical protein